MSKRRGPGDHRGRPRPAVRLAVTGVAVAALISGVAFLPSVLGEEDAEDLRPNVIVVVTDDQSADSLPRTPPVMPYLQGRILDPSDHWIVFRNGFVNTPLCCPSRVTMLTGTYPHNSGVRDNTEGELLDEAATLATWMQADGYHTGLVGKYLNLYPFDRGPYVPQGWDRWWGKKQGTSDSLYRGFTLIEQGREVHYDDEADYSTDVFASKAYEFIREAPEDRPFLLWFAPNAPHPPWLSAARHEGVYADLVVPKPPSTGEPDVSDKPAWVQGLPVMDEEELARMQESRRRSYEALLAVDEAMEGIVRELQASDRFDNTVIVYISDNGFAFGEHRWIKKTCEYDVCLRVPFAIRMPDVAHRIDPAFVSAVDLAPTIAEIAGVEPTIPMDGVSLLPLLRSEDRSDMRGGIYAEWVGNDRIPAWWEFRTSRFAYIELGTGEREFYALRDDPYELVNVIDDPRYADDVARLSAKLAESRPA